MMSIGYEVRLTPLQVLTLYNAIANNGQMVKPLFVEELRFHGNLVHRFEKEVIKNKICSNETLRKLKPMLEGVVENGTARNLRNSFYPIAGKTGTCQIADEKYGYTKGTYQASFAGYFPSDNPAYSCIVVVSSPSRSVYYGNLVAGPIFREVTDKIYVKDLNLQHEDKEMMAGEQKAPYSKSGYSKELTSALADLGITYENTDLQSDWVKTRSTEAGILLRESDINSLYLPDVSDMGAKDAVYLLENLGLEVEINGRGTVRGQVPVAGTVIKNGMKVTLEMSIR
jgi:cell division protein FtsI (penicillin-binding protein 3)